ncbi:MAG: hypothetical protein K6U74_04700 [Firmicutes bacterium]|nr:hypothetical protein [Bacillota bacterium]
MPTKQTSGFRSTLRDIFLFFSIFLLFFVSCLSWGLDLWNNNKFGGTNEDEVPEKGFNSLQDAKGPYPLTYSPSDFIRTFKLEVAQETGNYGSGETIAFIEADSNFDAQAYQDFCNTFAKDCPQLLPANLPLVFVNGRPVSDSRSPISSIETMMDIEWAHVIAPRANLIIIDASSNNFSQIRSIIERNHVTTVVSAVIDEGTAFTIRNPLLNGAFFPDLQSRYFPPFFQRTPVLKWLSSHTALFVSSGDAGSNIHPAVVAPESVIVGGVEESYFETFHDLSNFHIWPNEGYGKAIFDAFAPPWQKTEDNKSLIWRQVPDVVWLAGYPGVFVKTNLGWYRYGGTSLSAPCWAALWSLGNAAHKLNKGSPLPLNANQTLYLIAQRSSDAFSKDSDTNYGWTEKWGLGMPNPSKLVKALAVFDEKDVFPVSVFPISDIPFWIIAMPVIPASIFALIGYICTARRRVANLIQKLRLNRKVSYRKTKKCAEILKYPLKLLFGIWFLSAITTIILMQIPVNNYQEALFPKNPASLVTSRLFLLLVFALIFSDYAFKFLVQGLNDFAKKHPSPSSSQSDKKKDR